MKYDTPAGVPVYLDYGRKYINGRLEYMKTPPDAWEPPSTANGNQWIRPRT